MKTLNQYIRECMSKFMTNYFKAIHDMSKAHFNLPAFLSYVYEIIRNTLARVEY